MVKINVQNEVTSYKIPVENEVSPRKLAVNVIQCKNGTSTVGAADNIRDISRLARVSHSGDIVIT